MPHKGGGGDKTGEFFKSIINQKQDTIRWSFNYGGIGVYTRDEEGYTGLQIASKLGKVRSLEAILDFIRRSVMQKGGGDIRGGKKVKRFEELDCKDDDQGLTALMWACKGGYGECARLLHEIGASIDLKSDEGLTAAQYAKNSKKEDLIKWFERGCEEEEEKDAENEFPLVEGESTSDRRKRIKAIRAGGEKFAKIGSKKEDEDEEVDAEADAATAEEEARDAEKGPAPLWDEIKECRKNKTADLICLRQDSGDTSIDLSLFYCRQVNNLKLRLPVGVLTSLPPDLSRLKSLTTLIVSNNSLTLLPAEIGKLKGLKNLEFTDNLVTALPDELAQCEQLEVIDACRNKLGSISQLKTLHQLVTVKLDQNALVSLDGLSYKKLDRLTTLTASRNEIKELDERFARLGALTTLNLSSNKLKDLPLEMGDMKEKVLLHLNLDNNPFKDSKINKILEKGRAPCKELLNHLKKESESGKGKKKKGKESDGEEEEEEEEEAAAPEVAPEPEVAAPAQGGGGGGGGKNKKKGKGGKGGGGAAGMSDAQKQAAREEAMRKLGMVIPPAGGAPAAKKPEASAAPAAEAKEEEGEDKEEFDMGSEADDDDMMAYMVEGGDEEEEEDDDLDDFLSDKPKKEPEAKDTREKRIAQELEDRKKATAKLDAERMAKKKAHEEWLASMDEETRQSYFAEQERQKRAHEEAQREQEMELQRQRLEEMKIKAGAAASSAAAGADKGKDDRMENKWSYQNSKLVAEAVERKGPKKTVREIHIQFPTKRVGAIIGKAGVNIKIIEGKSNAKLQIHKPKIEIGGPMPEETLVTIKGRPESVDKACETVNLVLAQFAAHRTAAKSAPKKK